jgi:tRNA pseudouridine55 synthase
MKQEHAAAYMDGKVLFIDKPLTWTSFDVVNKIRKTLRQNLGIPKIKVGHTGTLDPLATGLMIVCTGRATKQIFRYQELDKTYETRIRLGSTTPSFDLETQVDETYPWEHITREMVENALIKLHGEQDQVPPAFSAKSIGGKRSYEMAREGKVVALRKQHVTIHRVEILSFDPPDLSIRVECSKGTYIRSIARDLGRSLGSGGHLTALRRTDVGPYHVSEAVPVDDFLKNLELL